MTKRRGLVGTTALLLWGATAALVAGQDGPSYRYVDDSLKSAPIVPGGSPYLPDGRTIAGDTGQPIPCRCVFRGQDFKVGQSVCMNTHVGTVLTRCELHLNNTSWTPTDTPCVTSEAPASPLRRLAASAR